MPDNSNIRFLAEGDFRERRTYLADECFALSGGPSPPPTDLVPQEQWDGLMHLPTDVSLRTTDYKGSLFGELCDLWGDWVEALPLEPLQKDFMFSSALDANDELQAAVFTASHGFYRQAGGSLRSALETLTIAAGFAVRDDWSRFQEWQQGLHEPKFGNGLDFLSQNDSLCALDQKLGNGGIFAKRTGVLDRLYKELCAYVHARANASNGAIWSSNGPVWVP
jgi:hypothetical protein